MVEGRRSRPQRGTASNMTVDLAEIKRWYEEHGVPYIASDWNGRDERSTSREVLFSVLHEDTAVPAWMPRDEEDRTRTLAVDAVLHGYMSRLKKRHRETLVAATRQGATQASVANELGVSQPAVSARLK